MTLAQTQIIERLKTPFAKLATVAVASLFALSIALLNIGIAFAQDPPQNVQASAGDEAVLVEWEEPDDTTDLVGFELRYRQHPTTPGVWDTVIDDVAEDPNADSYIVEDLTNGETYDFQVRAIYEEDESDWCCGDGSPGTLASATPFGPPSVPQNLVSTPGNGQVHLEWEEPADDNGAEVEEYLVEYRASEDAPGNWGEWESTDETESTVTGLENGTSYDFRVSAFNGEDFDGNPSQSNFVQANGLVPFTTPDAPEGFTATPGSQEVLLEWNPPTFDGGSAITGYLLEYRVTGTVPGNWTEIDDLEEDTQESYTVTGLTNGTGYDFRVSAINEAGNGATTTLNDIVPFALADAPQNLNATPDDRQVTLTWEAPENDGGFEIEEYLVEYALHGSGDWEDAGHSSDETSAVVTGLTNGTAYDFRVAAVTSAGTGSFATTANVTPFTNIPNNGDANGDGIPDADQDNVAGLVNPVTGTYAVLEADPTCEVMDGLSVNPESANTVSDNAFEYPVGLMNFTIDCGVPGFTATITQYFYGSYDAAQAVARKYRTTDNTYLTIPGATAQNETIGGQQVLTITYQITDGSELDEDGAANGAIVDPAGPAFHTAGAPNTGLGGNQQQSLWNRLSALLGL